eukprot:TRINITY_DN64610_c0_g1_i1.p1 TRINITY_DN64610_c0_g1~~TRINITY_DN64610_c0_g1_i1.p1  ORF type:complete len:600 (+),score=295.17 TRINITY_DN64610_c0_g1_i1:379-2178(+)
MKKQQQTSSKKKRSSSSSSFVRAIAKRNVSPAAMNAAAMTSSSPVSSTSSSSSTSASSSAAFVGPAFASRMGAPAAPAYRDLIHGPLSSSSASSSSSAASSAASSNKMASSPPASGLAFRNPDTVYRSIGPGAFVAPSHVSSGVDSGLASLMNIGSLSLKGDDMSAVSSVPPALDMEPKRAALTAVVQQQEEDAWTPEPPVNESGYFEPYCHFFTTLAPLATMELLLKHLADEDIDVSCDMEAFRIICTAWRQCSKIPFVVNVFTHEPKQRYAIEIARRCGSVHGFRQIYSRLYDYAVQHKIVDVSVPTLGAQQPFSPCAMPRPSRRCPTALMPPALLSRSSSLASTVHGSSGSLGGNDSGSLGGGSGDKLGMPSLSALSTRRADVLETSESDCSEDDDEEEEDARVAKNNKDNNRNNSNSDESELEPALLHNTVSCLVRMACSKFEDLQVQAVRALAQLSADVAYHRLMMEQIQGTDTQSGSRSALEALVHALSSDNEEMQRNAALGLANITADATDGASVARCRTVIENRASVTALCRLVSNASPKVDRQVARVLFHVTNALGTTVVKGDVAVLLDRLAASRDPLATQHASAIRATM